MSEVKSNQDLYDELLDGLMKREGGLDLHGPAKKWSVRESEMGVLFDPPVSSFSNSRSPMRKAAPYYLSHLLRGLAARGMKVLDGDVSVDLAEVIPDREDKHNMISKLISAARTGDHVIPGTAVYPTPERYHVGDAGDRLTHYRQFVDGSFPSRSSLLTVGDTGLKMAVLSRNGEASMAAMRIARGVLSGESVQYRGGDSELKEYGLRTRGFTTRLGTPLVKVETGCILVTDPSTQVYREIPFLYESDKPLSVVLDSVGEAAIGIRREFLASS